MLIVTWWIAILCELLMCVCGYIILLVTTDNASLDFESVIILASLVHPYAQTFRMEMICLFLR
jgi:hypothetical protein